MALYSVSVQFYFNFMEASVQIKTKDGLTLRGYLLNPVKDPKALLVLIHGMGEHAGRYSHVADFFAKQEFAVLRMDLRGHGKSEGKRGHTPSYDHLMNDLNDICQKARELYTELPVVFYGHSMGGNLVLNFMIRKKPQIAMAIVTAPYLKLAFEPPSWKVALGKLSAGIMPTLTQVTGLETAALSRDPEVVAAYEKDALVHDRITSAFFVNVHFAGPYAIQHAKEISVPTLVIHGTSDRLTSHKGSEELSQRSAKNVEVRFLEGWYHELHNEPEKEQVLKSISDWMNSKLN
jgi:acylglycerol lipase